MRIPIVENQSPEYVLQQIRHVTSLAMNAAEAGSLEDVLQQIADSARELIGSRYAALGVPNADGGLRFFKVSGVSTDDIKRIQHHPVGVGLLGSIMEAREPIRLNNMHTDPRAAGMPAGHPHMESLLGVPVQIGNQLFGTFYLTDKYNGLPFTEEDEWLLEMLASSAALAIAGAQLREQQEDLTRMAERERIAMELHDSVIQSLYALGLGLDFASRVEVIPHGIIKESLSGINKIIEDIRGYILKLNNGNGSNHIPVREHLEKAVSDLYIPPNLDVRIVASDMPTSLNYDVLKGLKSIIHECVSNTIRHAEANCVEIKAVEERNTFKLTIRDDGMGFIPGEAISKTGGGLGLHNIQKRARLYGGGVLVESAPGEGTVITVQVPMVRL